MDRWSVTRFESVPGTAPAAPDSRPADPGPAQAATGAGSSRDSAQRRFLSELALHTDGIGGVHVLHCLEQRGVWTFLAEKGSQGSSLESVARHFGGNLAYLNVAFRTFGVQGWLDWQPRRPVHQTHVTLLPAGLELASLLRRSAAGQSIVRFAPLARRMAHHLFGTYEPGSDTPALAALQEWNAAGWGLLDDTRVDRAVVRRLRLALEGNLLGPVAVALEDEFHPGLSGALLRRAPRAWRLRWVSAWARRRQRSQILGALAAAPGGIDRSRLKGHRERLGAAFAVLRDAGWVELEGRSVRLTAQGRYAAPRAWAYGVPVSYLPLFERIDELLFGDHRRVLRQVPGRPEAHVDRRMNVKASGATHGRYFAAADRVVLQAFNQPFEQQPRGFADMGSGDGSWLQHVWELIQRHTERGRLMQAFPDRPEYQVLMVGIDYNRAALRATRERLTRARVPHLALFGDVNDPEGLRVRLAEHGVDSRELLHASSFLIHNRPYRAPIDRAEAARRPGALAGAYVADGVALESQDLEQNLVEFFRAWVRIIGPHGMLVIELHDPERVIPGKTLTNYMLTHGLSDQLTVGLEPFLSAARAAGLLADPEHQQLFPAQRELATVSVHHFRRG